MPVSLRPYQPADFSQVVALFLLNTPAYFCPEEQRDLEHYLREEIEYYYVIEENNSIMAAGGCNIVDNTGRLSWYIVHPSAQGRSYGRQLAKYNLNILQNDERVNAIEVRTSQLVYPFYEKLGFKLLFTKDDYWGKGMHLYHMQLTN